MPYAARLSDLIEKSGLSIKEISKRCVESGTKITASYISMLKNPDNKKVPSDSISRALTNACGADNAEILVIEAYIDKAPQEMQHFFSIIREMVIKSVAYVAKDKVPSDIYENMQKNLENAHMTDILFSMNEIDFTQLLTSEKPDNVSSEKPGIDADFLKAISLPQEFSVMMTRCILLYRRE